QEDRELFCRNGLKWFSSIPAKRIRAAQKELGKQISRLQNRHHGGTDLLGRELELAARMAAESCRFMLWQQAVAKEKKQDAGRLARIGIRELKKLEKDFNTYWP